MPGRRKQAAHIRIPAQHRGLSDHGGNPGDRILQVIISYTKRNQDLELIGYLIYNAPQEYLELVLSGGIEAYLRKYTDYSHLA